MHLSSLYAPERMHKAELGAAACLTGAARMHVVELRAVGFASLVLSVDVPLHLFFSSLLAPVFTAVLSGVLASVILSPRMIVARTRGRARA